MSQTHAHQFLDHESLERLKQFVYSCGGSIDIQGAILEVELRSTIEVNQF